LERTVGEERYVDRGDYREEHSLVLEQRFAVVPEWVIDTEISDCAFRLYAVLLRYGQTSGQRMPGRALLAKRLHKTSKDTVDRALKELVAVGAVVVERRRTGRKNLTNRYHLMSTPPAARQTDVNPPGRKCAATPPGPIRAATPARRSAATLAASSRPNPVVPTDKNPPPTPSPTGNEDGGGGGQAAIDAALLEACGVDGLKSLADECQQLRRDLGKPTARWSAERLVEVLRETVIVRGWPARLTVPALRTLAADPATQGPMRLACPGPWWDGTQSESQLRRGQGSAAAAELEGLEVQLLEADGQRLWAQQQAREDLAGRGQPVTRLTVARRACQLLQEAEVNPC